MREFAEVPDKLNLSVDELCVAAACIGYKAIPCLRTNLTDMKYESVKKRVEETMLGLASKAELELYVNRRPVPSADLECVVRTACTPDRIISMRRSVPPIRDSLQVFISGDKAAVIKNGCDLFFFPDLTQLKSELKTAYDLTGTEQSNRSARVLLSELKHARRLYDSFQTDIADEYLASYVGEGKDLILEMFSASKGFIIMKRWSKLDKGYENDRSDIILVRDKQLYRAYCSPNEMVSIKGISSEQFSNRISEYLTCEEDR